jgi:uncharacterized protein YegL/Flp pilus assembly protein TadG
MLVFVTVALVLLFVAAVFSVDIAYMFLVREQLQVATDAAAKAAVVALAQGSSSQQATNTAISYAGQNKVGANGLTIAGGNVSLGKVVYAQSGAWTFSSGGTPLIAAQVTGSVSSPLFFAPVLGSKTFTTRNSSTAAFVRNKWCLVFDRSGSMCFDMSGNDWYYPPPTGYLNGQYPGSSRSPYYPDATNSRLGNLYTGATTFLNALTNSPGGTASNEVGMVTFADSANTDCQFTSNYSAISTQLHSYLTTNIWSDGIANGGTNLSAGLQAAINMFISDANTDKTVWNKVIIVFSDGQWNQGNDPINGGSPTIVSQANSNSITIYTVGLLQQSNNATMQNLASQTGGQFYYVTTGTALQNAFQALAQTIPVILTQ